ncbi:MAG: group III truncated hemoglobin [Flavobacteriales bacterium]|nr:group III truncated hemoglobin [Flavobacteriales bacterium]MCL4856450.1 group III truncated hemoglobin [Flavobacteriales bacterium]
MKPDISSQEDIKLLVDTFYNKVQTNATLGYIFNDVAKLNWDEHLPKMYSFWGSLLLQEHSYQGNPMQIHVELSKITTMSSVEFSEWINLFYQTVDELFEGEIASEAKIRAANIARLMQHRIEIIK